MDIAIPIECGLHSALMVGRKQLSPRQMQIARLVVTGMQDKQISAELSISEETVGHHLRRVFVKLGVHTRSELVAWYCTTFGRRPNV